MINNPVWAIRRMGEPEIDHLLASLSKVDPLMLCVHRVPVDDCEECDEPDPDGPPDFP